MFKLFGAESDIVRRLTIVVLAAFAVPGLTVVAVSPAAASTDTYYVTPSGSGSACTLAAPCTVAAAQTKVQGLTATAAGGIVVSVGAGTYPLSSTWSFGPADSGKDASHVVRWQAAAGATPLFTSAKSVTGWAQVGTSAIWKAPVPAGVTDSRQLYVDGARAVRARTAINPSGFTATSTGYTTTTAASLAAYHNPSSIEAVLHGAWVYARCPIGSVSGTTVTMSQPCWDHTTKLTLVGGAPYYLENAHEFVDQPGEWYLDKTGAVAGNSTPAIYYMPQAGQALTGANALTVTVPSVQTLLNVAGTGVSAGARVHNLQFSGLTFADSSWLFPSTAEGFDEMQANMTWTGSTANRNIYDAYTKTPAAVEFSYVNDVAIIGNTFTRIGSVGLDVADSSNNVTIEGNRVFDTSANGINIGGITPEDQRPGDVNGTEHTTTTTGDSFNYTFTGTGIEYQTTAGPTRGTADVYIDNTLVQSVNCSGTATKYQQTCASVHGLTNGSHTLKLVKTGGTSLSLDALRPFPSQASIDDTNASITYTGSWSALTGQTSPADRMHDITVRNNYIHDIATEFQSGVGIWAGFVDTLKIQNNEIADVPYTGVSVGWGWGYLDQTGGGNNGNEPPATPTIAANNEISGNYVHNFMLAGADGGALYFQGSQPNSTIHDNYIANGTDVANARGIYLDNGSQHFTINRNVVDRVISWTLISDHYSQPYALNNSLSNNWANTTSKDCCSSSTNSYDSSNNDSITGQAWPTGAQAVINAAGLQTSATDVTGSSRNWATELKPQLSTTNLALGATASASSNNSSAYDAAKAIDGNTVTRWLASTNAATLTVTLPTAKSVNRVVWREARGCCNARIQAYSIDYWDGAVWKSVAGGSFPQVSQVNTFYPVTTTKIRLNVTAAVSPPTLTEFEIYGDNSDLMQGQKASQSSTYGSAAAARAADGNTDGNFYNNSVSHTQNDAQGWWLGDLGAIRGVGDVQIYNRTDGNADRLTDYWVFVSQNPLDPTLSPTTQASRPGVWSNHQTSQAGTPTTITPGISGRYVMVQLSGTNYLNIAEVKVLPKLTPSTPSLVNIAQGQPASQSSTYGSSAAALAADGNTDGNYFDGSVSHTNNNLNAWWQVDVGSTRAIANIEVWNRTDGNADRESDYWVFVSTTPFNTALTPTAQATASGVVWSNHQTTQAGTPTTIPANAAGRFVMVQLSGTNYLNLAEVRVMSQ